MRGNTGTEGVTLRKVTDRAILDRTIERVEHGLVHFREVNHTTRRSRVRSLPASSFRRWALEARSVECSGGSFALGLAVGRLAS
jgi:hypothetical protein